MSELTHLETMMNEPPLVLKCAWKWKEMRDDVGYGEAICTDGEIHKVTNTSDGYSFSDNDWTVDDTVDLVAFRKAKVAWVNHKLDEIFKRSACNERCAR